ncbi:hypothetical protein H0H93_003682 [Arthromyces matolae]|nr:hypothetical protein H0H93_003682 [Arthromyces matolae]
MSANNNSAIENSDKPAMGRVTQPAPAAVSFSSVNPSLKKKLEVFIRDHRLVPPSEEATELELQLYPAAIDGSDGWLVSGRELLLKLQQTLSPIRGQGLIRVGIPNQHVPQYTQFFVEATANQLPTAMMNPELIHVPPFNTSFPCITLKIHNGLTNPALTHITNEDDSPSENNAEENSDDDDDDDDDDDPGLIYYLSEDEVTHVARELATRADSLAKSLPGFANIYGKASSRSLKNQEIVQIWEFRAAFWDHYLHRCCRKVTNLPNIASKRITGECICRALNIVPSTMMQARDGMRLIHRYALGVTAHQEVMAEIAKEGAGNRSKLLDFLQKWEASHL